MQTNEYFKEHSNPKKEAGEYDGMIYLFHKKYCGLASLVSQFILTCPEANGVSQWWAVLDDLSVYVSVSSDIYFCGMHFILQVTEDSVHIFDVHTTGGILPPQTVT